MFALFWWFYGGETDPSARPPVTVAWDETITGAVSMLRKRFCMGAVRASARGAWRTKGWNVRIDAILVLIFKRVLVGRDANEFNQA